MICPRDDRGPEIDPARVLVIEDNTRLASVVARSLRDHGYEVEVAQDGELGGTLLRTNAFDAGIVDVTLPGTDGFAVIRNARRTGVTTPLMIVTARDSVEDRVRGLDEGADDYLVKPFAVSELHARLRALLRRRAGPPVLAHGDLVLDVTRHRVRRGSESIDLTPREFALLDYFMRHPDQVLTRTRIGEAVWDMNFELTSNVVDVYVRYLRRKIDRPGEPSLITTERGLGYRFGRERA